MQVDKLQRDFNAKLGELEAGVADLDRIGNETRSLRIDLEFNQADLRRLTTEHNLN